MQANPFAQPSSILPLKHGNLKLRDKDLEIQNIARYVDSQRRPFRRADRPAWRSRSLVFSNK